MRDRQPFRPWRQMVRRPPPQTPHAGNHVILIASTIWIVASAFVVLWIIFASAW